MHVIQLVRKLGRNDAKLIGRDRFLLFMLVFVIYLAAALRFGLPWANTYLAEQEVLPSETVANTLADFYPMIVAWMVMFTGALLAGTIFGFMLLDEKEDNTIKAMLVTPVSFNQYVLYRVGGPTVLAFFIVAGMVLFIDQALVPLWQLLLIAAGASLTAPNVALFYATFAENKVQGFAVSKFAGVAGWLIILGWFVADPLQWLFGLFPPFLISKAYWMALEGQGLWWAVLLGGIVLQAGLLFLMMQRFNKVAYR